MDRTVSQQHIQAGVTAAGFLMVKKMLGGYLGGGRVVKQEKTVRIHAPNRGVLELFFRL